MATGSGTNSWQSQKLFIIPASHRSNLKSSVLKIYVRGTSDRYVLCRRSTFPHSCNWIAQVC